MSIRVNRLPFNRVGKTWSGTLAQRRETMSSALVQSWGGGLSGGIKSTKMSRRQQDERGLEVGGEVWLKTHISTHHQPRDNAHIRGNTLDHSGRCSEKERRGAQNSVQCLVAGQRRSSSQGTWEEPAEINVVAARRG